MEELPFEGSIEEGEETRGTKVGGGSKGSSTLGERVTDWGLAAARGAKAGDLPFEYGSDIS